MSRHESPAIGVFPGYKVSNVHVFDIVCLVDKNVKVSESHECRKRLSVRIIEESSILLGSSQ